MVFYPSKDVKNDCFFGIDSHIRAFSCVNLLCRKIDKQKRNCFEVPEPMLTLFKRVRNAFAYIKIFCIFSGEKVS